MSLDSSPEVESESESESESAKNRTKSESGESGLGLGAIPNRDVAIDVDFSSAQLPDNTFVSVRPSKFSTHQPTFLKQ